MNNKSTRYFVENYTQYMEQERADLSSSLIHMTKNLKILSEILRTQRLISSSDVLFCVSSENQNTYKTVSFTEMPVSQIIKANALSIATKKSRMTLYGIEFHRRTLIENYSTLNPVLYIFNEKLKKIFCELFASKYFLDQVSNSQQIIPYIKFISPTNNFYWEREWRHLGDFKFSLNQIKYILVPTEADADKIAEDMENYPTLYFKTLDMIEKIIVYEFNNNLTEKEMSTPIKGYYMKIVIDKDGNKKENVYKTFF